VAVEVGEAVVEGEQDQPLGQGCRSRRPRTSFETVVAV
jgi:hypothetical protein